MLGKRDAHKEEAANHNIQWIDLVVCNLYPFEQTIAQQDVTTEKAIENIDIGGPTMVRAAAKNVEWVGIITDPEDYESVAEEIRNTGLSFETRRSLSQKAFSHTAQYDAMIANYFLASPFPDVLNESYRKTDTLRYGENPHQQASVYRHNEQVLSILGSTQLQGKTLSYNNLVDAQAALEAVANLDKPACAVIKHAQPCGMAQSSDITAGIFECFYG